MPLLASPALTDSFGRLHDSLRISVTDRCNIRCEYCMPDTEMSYRPREEILNFSEIERFTRVAARRGVRKLRLTGGEPLIRKDLAVLVRLLAAIPGIDEVALTTNGVLLADRAAELFAAGLRRINVHLDTLDRERYRRITRRDELPRVLNGLAEARRTGFQLKINAVMVRASSEPDVAPLARYGRESGFEIRYIEFMPLDAEGLWKAAKVLPADDILLILRREVGDLFPVAMADPRVPAVEYRFADGVGSIGFIASVTKPFCGNCNRLRLTADGKLRYCLFAIEEVDVRGLLRNGANDDDLESAIRRSLAMKWAGHEINAANFVAPPRKMCAIGG
jgi:cyclic pyranopterin phosphate synthase